MLLVLTLAAGGMAAGCARAPQETFRASGTIEGTDAQVAVKVPGVLLEVRPHKGDAVDSAQVIARVDTAQMHWRLAQAVAARKLAAAQLEQALNGPRPQELARARALLAQAAAQLEVARADLERIRNLASSGTATPQKLDQARARYGVAVAARDQARAALDLLEAGTREEQIAAARARLAQTRAQVAAARQSLADCTVRAPFAGVVTERLMEPGEMAAPGSAVLTVTRLDPIKLRVYLTELEVGRIRLGQAVQVFLDSAPERALSGHVSYICPEAEFTPKNVQTRDDRVKLVFAVEVRLPNPEGLLKPGLPADAVFGGEGP